jgi:hypothetical protein
MKMEQNKMDDTHTALNAKRKRGGQAGNNNAFKHGFYSLHYKQAEQLQLSQVPMANLSNEIELLRIQMLRCFEAEAASLNAIDYETRLQALRTISLAAESLTRLIRTQFMLNVSQPETEANDSAEEQDQ